MLSSQQQKFINTIVIDIQAVKFRVDHRRAALGILLFLLLLLLNGMFTMGNFRHCSCREDLFSPSIFKPFRRNVDCCSGLFKQHIIAVCAQTQNPFAYQNSSKTSFLHKTIIIGCTSSWISCWLSKSYLGNIATHERKVHNWKIKGIALVVKICFQPTLNFQALNSEDT